MHKPTLDDLIPREGQILTGSLFSEPVRVAEDRGDYQLSVDALRSQPGGGTVK